MRAVVGILALVLACGLLPDVSSADGLRKIRAPQLIVQGAQRPSGNVTSAPVSLSDSAFVIPYVSPAAVGGGMYLQQVDAAYALSGAPINLFPSDQPGGGPAENGGVRLGGGSTAIFWSINSVCCSTEVYRGLISETGVADEVIVSISGSAPGAQGGAVAVSLTDGRAFVAWADHAFIPGQSASSARGVFVSTNGSRSGSEVALENLNGGSQTPTDGVQLSDGNILIVYRHQGTALTSVIYYGQLISPAGSLIGSRFVLGRSGIGSSGAAMRVDALPGGRFVAVWIDDQSGSSLPYARIFEADGSPARGRFLIGDSASVLGATLDVAALPDGRFVIAGALVDSTSSILMARLFTATGAKAGAPLFLQNTSPTQPITDIHVGAVHRLLPSPVKANDVYVVWRRNKPAQTYDLVGQALRPN